MKLIGRYDSRFVRRVGPSMHLLGLDFEHISISPFSQAAEMRRFNPLGRMPALVPDDGPAILDSVAILDYLDELFPERLIPAGGPARREAWRVVSLATGVAEKAVSLNYERRRPAERQYATWADRCRDQVAAGLAELDSAEWSGSLRQAEITTACVVAYVDGVLPVLGTYRNLAALSSRCEAHPAFRSCPARP